jgi:RNA polymerase sigma factor (sigma-70 family)
MADEPGSRTSATLLGRLRELPTDQAAWGDFVNCYGKKIYGWCRRWELQPADADNVTQAVLLKLARAMQSFEYDRSRSFRAWLKTLAHHAWQDLAKSRRPLAVAGDARLEEVLASLEARDDLATRLESAWEQDLLDIAMASVRLRVHPKTWEAFHLTALQEIKADEVGQRLGMELTSVYKAKSNVQKMLQEEIRHLEGEERA